MFTLDECTPTIQCAKVKQVPLYPLIWREANPRAKHAMPCSNKWLEALRPVTCLPPPKWGKGTLAKGVPRCVKKGDPLNTLKLQ